MRVFVTGATGWVGSAVTKDLLASGHQVLGLARAEEKAQALAATGAEVLRGTLDDLDLLRQGAEAADAVIHTAFSHDFSKFAENCAQDERAIATMGAVLEGTNKQLLVTSGMARLAEGQGRLAIEADRPPPVSPAYPRASEAAARALAGRGVRAGAVRLPPSVHGKGDHGFVPHLIALAREKGISAYIGAGNNGWASVHRFDAAPVYRLALESGVTDDIFHAVADEAVPFKEIAGLIGRKLGVPVRSLTPEEAAAHFGWFAVFAGLEMTASSQQTRDWLGWRPIQPSLLEDLEDGHYFDSGASSKF
jgi:nucleoside-diphosphate-sugar epimerase